MAKHKKSDGVVKAFGAIAVFLCLGAAVGGAVLSSLSNRDFELERVEDIEISGVEDIKALGDKVYNDNLSLTGDIVIDDAEFSIGSSERPFMGKFNGNGHTVTVNYGGQHASKSLFGCIEEAGEICNVNFVVNGASVAVNSYGLIAQINYGTIKNCTVTFEGFEISGEDGIYSAGVVINKGAIENVVVKSAFSSKNALEDEKPVLFGGLCVYNYGTIKNNVVVPEFTGFKCTRQELILKGNATNVGISALCSATVDNGKTENNLAVINGETYTCDKVSNLNVVSSVSAAFNEDLFLKYNFDNNVWRLQGGKLELKAEG